MQTLSRGQRLKLADLVDTSVPFTLNVQVKAGFATDLACFGVDGRGNLLGDPYMVFFNQLLTPCGGVQLQLNTGAHCFPSISGGCLQRLSGWSSRPLSMARA